MPTEHIHEPWKIPPLEAKMTGLCPEKLHPIIDLKAASEHARKSLWAHKNHPEVKKKRIGAF